jgi:hypothetical protein
MLQRNTNSMGKESKEFDAGERGGEKGDGLFLSLLSSWMA